MQKVIRAPLLPDGAEFHFEARDVHVVQLRNTGLQAACGQLPDGAAGFCSDHFAMAPASQRERFLTVLRRLRALREIWSDEARYDAIVASGRYLKLAHATCCAEEALDMAAQRLTLAIIAVQNSASHGASLRRIA